MPARLRVALLGFSDFERNTLALCFRLAPSRIPAYDEVDDVAEADFMVADAEVAGIVSKLTKVDRLADTVFVGPHSVPGTLAHVRRPIDPILVVRELDALAALRGARARRTAAAPPELTDDVSAELPPAVSVTQPGDLGEPTRPYVRVAEPEEAPLPDLEVSEMFELPDVFVPETPAPTPAAETSDDPQATSGAATADVEIPLEPAAPPAPSERAPLAPAPLAPAPLASAPLASAPPAPVEPASSEPVWPDARAQAKARARAAAARRRNATQIVSGGDTPLDALVLDDSDIAAQYLGQLLEELGFQVHLATTGAEALDVLTHQPITLACLDLALAEGDEFDGLDICQRIKHEPLALGGSQPLVVLVSGQARATDRVRATLAGSDGFLTKPFGKQELVRVLESCGMTLLPTLTLPVGDRPPA